MRSFVPNRHALSIFSGTRGPASPPKESLTDGERHRRGDPGIGRVGDGEGVGARRVGGSQKLVLSRITGLEGVTAHQARERLAYGDLHRTLVTGRHVVIRVAHDDVDGEGLVKPTEIRTVANGGDGDVGVITGGIEVSAA